MATSWPSGTERLSSSNHLPPSARERKCCVLPAGPVTAALRVRFARRRSGWAKGSQSLKLPTTDTAPSGSSAGSAKVTRTVPSCPGLVVLINCSPHSGSNYGMRVDYRGTAGPVTGFEAMATRRVVPASTPSPQRLHPAGTGARRTARQDLDPREHDAQPRAKHGNDDAGPRRPAVAGPAGGAMAGPADRTHRAVAGVPPRRRGHRGRLGG